MIASTPTKVTVSDWKTFATCSPTTSSERSMRSSASVKLVR
jgi:hypothetical protein